MPFEPVSTLEELDSLDDADMCEGYRSAERGDPEPGENRGKSFWHGWRCRMMDFNEIPIDPVHYKLVGLWVERERQRSSAF
jgi:hypothetical protein